MEHLLFAVYLILFAWLVTKVPFFIKSGLTPSQLVIAFLLKVMAAIFYGWIGVYYGQMARMVDTWAFFYESQQELKLLVNQPAEFVLSFFRSNYADGGYSRFLSVKNSWWNDLDINFLVKLFAVFNVFSFSNYFINTIFFSFLTLFGPIALYRMMADAFPQQKFVILLTTFLFPSFIYWTSGLHKDGLIFMGITLAIYSFYFGFLKKRREPKYWLMAATGFLLLLVLRNFLLLFLVPAVFSWWLTQKVRFKPLFTFGMVYLLMAILFFSTRFIHPKLDFPEVVAARQQAFINLEEGGSTIPVFTLRPTVTSFIRNAPEAFSFSLLRPYVTDVQHLLSLAAAAEIHLLLLLFVMFLFRRRKQAAVLSGGQWSGFPIFCLFFSLSVLLFIGYTVNNLGAIVRYRSIVLPFLVVPMMGLIHWPRLREIFSGNIINKRNIL